MFEEICPGRGGVWSRKVDQFCVSIVEGGGGGEEDSL